VEADVGIVLGDNRYGKAETRLLRVTRSGDVHEIRDLEVSVALSGDFEAVHLRGDNSAVLPTDSQKNAVYALAREAPVGEIEDFALRLARHFVASAPAVRRARVQVDEHRWERIDVEGHPHPHAFSRAGDERRQALAVAEADGAWVAAGLAGLLLLKSTGSEFRGFLRDRYTTLAETGDRVMATAVTARWRFSTVHADWAASFAGARRALLETFAGPHSLSLQQTLYEMGRAVLEARPEVAEIRLILPNRHHFVVDLAPFGLANDGEVLQVADRPYGLIEGVVRREGAPEGPALDW
jgi:urate oxidase